MDKRMNERHKKRRRIIISRVYRQVGIHRCTSNLAIALISAFVYVTKGWWMQQLVHDRDSWNYSNRWNWLYATITFLRSLTSPPPSLPLPVVELVSVVIRGDDVQQEDILGLRVQSGNSELHLREHLPGTDTGFD